MRIFSDGVLRGGQRKAGSAKTRAWQVSRPGSQKYFPFRGDFFSPFWRWKSGDSLLNSGSRAAVAAGLEPELSKLSPDFRPVLAGLSDKPNSSTRDRCLKKNRGGIVYMLSAEGRSDSEVARVDTVS
jgi:hypothetical protein